MEELGINTALFESNVEDMDIPFKYDSIIMPFGSFQLLHPRVNAYKTLEAIRKHLNHGGKLIVELFIPWQAICDIAEEKPFHKQIILNDGKIINYKAYHHSYPEEQYYHSRGNYEKSEEGVIIARESEDLYIHWYYRYEFELIMEKYGFKILEIHTNNINGQEYKVYVVEKIS